MSLSVQLVLGATALMALLGGIVWRSSVVADREDARESAASAGRRATT